MKVAIPGGTGLIGRNLASRLGAAGHEPLILTRNPERIPDWLEDLEIRRWRVGGEGQEKALAEIRRAFHTLKGSGRMVGAGEIGEFAWRFEEMLNHLIEGRIGFTAPLGHGLTLAAGALNSLRDRLVGEPSELEETGIRALADFARQLTAGGQPDPAALEAALPASLMRLITDLPEDEDPIRPLAEAAAQAAADTPAPEPEAEQPPTPKEAASAAAEAYPTAFDDADCLKMILDWSAAA